MIRNLVTVLLLTILSCSVSYAFVVRSPPTTAARVSVKPPSTTTTTTTTQLDATALIVQNKGGGHGELGYHLAKLLSQRMDEVTIVQDDACKKDKEPFRSYATDLPSNVNVIYAPIGNDDDETITDVTKFQSTILQGKTYNYIWDNASKSNTGLGKTILDCAKLWNTDLKLLCYVSSAGIYKPSKDHGRNPLNEITTPIKTTAGQNLYDQYAIDNNLPLVSFRPQYIYGPKSNKFDYLDYFFDRLVRNLPVPIPYDGNQLVSVTNAEDVASLLASPLNNEGVAVTERIFNCGTDQLLSYNDLTYACAAVAGIPKFTVKIEYFNPDELGTKGNFPFRETDFFVTPDRVQSKLQWSGPQHNLVTDLEWYYTDYIQNRNGRDRKVPNLIKDWEIVVGCKTSLPEYTSSIYERYDPLIFTSYEPTK